MSPNPCAASLQLLLSGGIARNEPLIRAVKTLGLTPALAPDETPVPALDVRSLEAVVCNSLFLHRDIREFESLRFIQLTSAGTDRVPLDYINERGIILRTARGVYSVPMAESAIAGILGCYRHMGRFHENQRSRVWVKDRELRELAGQTVCIVGMGSVGQEMAIRLKAFGTTVIGIDAVPDSLQGCDRVLSTEALDQVLPECDIAVLTLPLTEATAGMFDAQRLSRLKPGALLVNIARGGIVDESALIQALESGHLGGAVLDVFETEPLPEASPLWAMDNVIITPHNSFVSDRAGRRLHDLVIGNLQEYLRVRS